MILIVVTLSSKVTVIKSFCSKSYFLTPLISFRIAPILCLFPQALQPGMFNFATLSLASASLPNDARRSIINKIIIFLFMIVSTILLGGILTTFLTNLQMQFIIDSEG